MNTNITITRDKVLTPAATVLVSIPEDMTKLTQLRDVLCVIDEATTNAMCKMVEKGIETYKFGAEVGVEPGTIEPEGEPIRPALPDAVRERLLKQLGRLDKLATTVDVESKVQQSNLAVESMSMITTAMCKLAQELRV